MDPSKVELGVVEAVKIVVVEVEAVVVIVTAAFVGNFDNFVVTVAICVEVVTGILD